MFIVLDIGPFNLSDYGHYTMKSSADIGIMTHTHEQAEIILKHWNMDVPQHCSNPAIRERARDSTEQRETKEKFLKVRLGPLHNWKFSRLFVFKKKIYLQWGKEPRHTALLSIVTRNMWQFLKSDSILSIDSILKQSNKHNI